jgi:hypothetical protein
MRNINNSINESNINVKIKKTQKSQDNKNDIYFFIEYGLLLMLDYIEYNIHLFTELYYDEQFQDYIMITLVSLFENIEYNEDSKLFYSELDDVIENIFNLFYEYFIPPRSYNDTFILNNSIGRSNNITKNIENQINYLRNIPQPVQRTQEWYDYRKNLITASNAHKCFDTPKKQNEIIYEKCSSYNLNLNSTINMNLKLENNINNEIPILEDCDIYIENDKNKMIVTDNTNKKNKVINIKSSLQWGQLLEPVSVMIYELLYNTKIEDFGCITHPLYPFLGASPDGINVSKKGNTNKSKSYESRYGRMLEIKNTVSRVIDGIPKKEYWIQMQLQMETCNLDSCDFLETNFIEYNSEEEFLNDGTFLFSKEKYSSTKVTNKESFERNKFKGIILYFTKHDNTPFYQYKPLAMDKDEFDIWEENMITKYQSDEYKMCWIQNIYWKLDVISCVLVLRNKLWFEKNISIIKNIWDIIEKERVEGYDHRAPNKRTKRSPVLKIDNFIVSKCLIKPKLDLLQNIDIPNNENMDD